MTPVAGLGPSGMKDVFPLCSLSSSIAQHDGGRGRVVEGKTSERHAEKSAVRRAMGAL